MERISSFLEHILQPIAQAQKTYLKDTTQFINFIEKRKVPKHASILQENSFQFKGEHYLQTRGTAMGTKVAVSFANIFMSVIETKIINKSKIKPLEWKRYIDDVFSLWDTKREEIDQFILDANRHHQP